MDNKTNILIDEKALENANLAELKREKEELKQYYLALKKRRDAILSINNIKNKSQKQKLLEQNQKDEVPVALIFQEGSFKQKRDKTILLSHNDNRDKVIVDEADIIKPKDFAVDKPIDFFADKPMPPMVVKEERRAFTKRPLDTPSKLDGDLNIQPITNQNVAASNTPPPAIAPTELSKQVENAPITQTSAPELAKAEANKTTIDTNTIQPDDAIVLEPFDVQKTDSEINEDINTLLPKNSKTFITMISILSIILILLLIVFIFWGFASNWNFNIENFANDFKSFFGF